jgi:hypothetical protein
LIQRETSAKEIYSLNLLVYADDDVSWQTIVNCFALFHDGGGNTNDIQSGISLNKNAVFADNMAVVKKPLQPDIFQ